MINITSFSESTIETALFTKFQVFQHTCRTDIPGWKSFEEQFLEKFEALYLVLFSDGEFARLRDEMMNELYSSSKLVRHELHNYAILIYSTPVGRIYGQVIS